MTIDLVPAADAVRRIPSGSRVLATCCGGTPNTLLRELGRAAEEIDGLSLNTGLVLGPLPFLDAVRAGTLGMTTWHVTGEVRRLVREGVGEYVPIRAGDIPAWLPGTFDVLLLRVSSPDARGYCSMGPSTSWTRAALDAAPLVIAEIDADLPVTCGDSLVHVSELHIASETDTPSPTYEPASTSDISNRIAERVLELLPRDVTAQLGIGAIPETVAAKLIDADLGRLGVVGMGCDQMIPLLDATRRGRLGEPVLWSVELLGTRDLLDVAHRNPAVSMVSSALAHNPLWLAERGRLVSVNSAVEVDLTGQVASETVAGSPVAGIGGSADFFEGAHLSSGGLRIIALPAATPDGAISKIVPRLAEGTPVTIARHSVDVVVTEHGVAHLTGRGVRERAEALLAVVAPEFVDVLSEHVPTRRTP